MTVPTRLEPTKIVILQNWCMQKMSKVGFFSKKGMLPNTIGLPGFTSQRIRPGIIGLMLRLSLLKMSFPPSYHPLISVYRLTFYN